MSQAIDAGLFLEIGGIRQWVTVRGQDRANPALLILPGAGAGFSRLAPFFAPWEADFTVAQWDQPGAGFTAAANPDDPQPLTYGRLVRDGLAIVETLKARFGIDGVALAATSGGTVVALQMAKARPELLTAYVGAGQVVNRAQQEALSYVMVLGRARAAGDAAAVAELEGIGPPPYADVSGDLVKSRYANAPTAAEAAEWAQIMALPQPAGDARYVPRGLAAGDPQATAFGAYMAVRDELAAFDAYALGPHYELPMIFIQGEDDAHTVTPLVAEFARWVRTPQVSHSRIAGAGHLAFFLRRPMLERLKALIPR